MESEFSFFHLLAFPSAKATRESGEPESTAMRSASSHDLKTCRKLIASALDSEQFYLFCQEIFLKKSFRLFGPNLHLDFPFDLIFMVSN